MGRQVVVVVVSLLLGCALAPSTASIGTVTCTMTIDNVVEKVYLDGVDSSALLTSTCKENWETPCTFSFADDSWDTTQLLAVEGSDWEDLSAGEYCAKAGFALACSSTASNSAWNDVRSDTTSAWRSDSTMTQEASLAWTLAPFDDSAWADPSASTSGFNCASCGTTGNGAAWAKIWGDGCSKYSYYRRTVATSVDCVGAWGAWGACSGTCGVGTQARTFAVTTEASPLGAACVAADEDEETLPCSNAACCDGDGDSVCDDVDSCAADAENDEDGDNTCGNEDVCPYDADDDADGDSVCGDVDSCAADAENDADGDNTCGNADACPYDADDDADADGICGDVDSCAADAENDADDDLLCGNEDECAYDAENDIDVDDLCGNDDVCPHDPANDFDGDGVCGDVDSCAEDAENDADSDAICFPTDVCAYDAEHDADSDEICGDVDSCPYDAGNDIDSDEVCQDVDSCHLDAANDADSDVVCGNLDECPQDGDNDADGDAVCGDVDSCPFDEENDADSDSVCADVDSCPHDAENDADGDSVCGDVDSCAYDAADDEDSDSICGSVDSCAADADNDADDDAVCGDKDACPYDADNDADSDDVCGDVDSCAADAMNDIDGDGVCGDLDSCASDAENDGDSDMVCGEADPCPLDPDDDADSDGLCGDVDSCADDAGNDADSDLVCGGVWSPSCAAAPSVSDAAGIPFANGLAETAVGAVVSKSCGSEVASQSLVFGGTVTFTCTDAGEWAQTTDSCEVLGLAPAFSEALLLSADDETLDCPGCEGAKDAGSFVSSVSAVTLAAALATGALAPLAPMMLMLQSCALLAKMDVMQTSVPDLVAMSQQFDWTNFQGLPLPEGWSLNASRYDAEYAAVLLEYELNATLAGGEGSLLAGASRRQLNDDDNATNSSVDCLGRDELVNEVRQLQKLANYKNVVSKANAALSNVAFVLLAIAVLLVAQFAVLGILVGVVNCKVRAYRRLKTKFRRFTRSVIVMLRTQGGKAALEQQWQQAQVRLREQAARAAENPPPPKPQLPESQRQWNRLTALVLDSLFSLVLARKENRSFRKHLRRIKTSNAREWKVVQDRLAQEDIRGTCNEALENFILKDSAAASLETGKVRALARVWLIILVSAFSGICESCSFVFLLSDDEVAEVPEVASAAATLVFIFGCYVFVWVILLCVVRPGKTVQWHEATQSWISTDDHQVLVQSYGPLFASFGHHPGRFLFMGLMMTQMLFLGLILSLSTGMMQLYLMLANEAWIMLLYFAWRPYPRLLRVYGGCAEVDQNVLGGVGHGFLIVVLIVMATYPVPACEAFPAWLMGVLITLIMVPVAVPFTFLLGMLIVKIRDACRRRKKKKQEHAARRKVKGLYGDHDAEGDDEIGANTKVGKPYVVHPVLTKDGGSGDDNDDDDDDDNGTNDSVESPDAIAFASEARQALDDLCNVAGGGGPPMVVVQAEPHSPARRRRGSEDRAVTVVSSSDEDEEYDKGDGKKAQGGKFRLDREITDYVDSLSVVLDLDADVDDLSLIHI